MTLQREHLGRAEMQITPRQLSQGAGGRAGGLKVVNPTVRCSVDLR